MGQFRLVTMSLLHPIELEACGWRPVWNKSEIMLYFNCFYKIVFDSDRNDSCRWLVGTAPNENNKGKKVVTQGSVYQALLTVRATLKTFVAARKNASLRHHWLRHWSYDTMIISASLTRGLENLSSFEQRLRRLRKRKKWATTEKTKCNWAQSFMYATWSSLVWRDWSNEIWVVWKVKVLYGSFRRLQRLFTLKLFGKEE